MSVIDQINIPGWIVETNVGSYTGKILYSDHLGIWSSGNPEFEGQSSILNEIASIPILGIAAGITRVALGIIHTLGHVFLGVVTFERGHFFHAAKGSCEILCGLIEALPVIGRIFAYKYRPPVLICDPSSSSRSWWIMKIYNPNKPDRLDQYMGLWNHWKQVLPTNYIKA